jgi:hypothetical protein
MGTVVADAMAFIIVALETVEAFSPAGGRHFLRPGNPSYRKVLLRYRLISGLTFQRCGHY